MFDIELVIFPLIIRVCSGAFHCTLDLGVLLVYVSEKLLLGWNFVLCLLGMRNMRLLEKYRERCYLHFMS